MTENELELLATGMFLVGGGVRSIEAVLKEQMNQAKREIKMTAFTFGDYGKDVITMIDEALQKGVSVTLIVDHLTKQATAVQTELKKLANQYPYLKIVDFNRKGEVLHAKVIVFDRKIALIGSANLSWRAMSKNHELAILLKGKEVTLILQAIEKLEKQQGG